MTRSHLVKTARIVTVAAAWLAYSSPSHAYLDPGTGSIILQSILAGIAVALGVLRLYWHRFKMFISSLTGGRNDQENETTQEFSEDPDIQNDV